MRKRTWPTITLVGLVAPLLAQCGDSSSSTGGAGGQSSNVSNGASNSGPGSGTNASSTVTSSASAGTGGGSMGGLADPSYKEGFGRDAAGGAGRAVYIVTSSADSGPGSLEAAFEPSGTANDMTIVFAVDTATLTTNVYIGSHVTIDGLSNGMNGVTLDVTSDLAHGLVVQDPATNVVVRGINFRSAGAPNSGFPDVDLLALDGTNGAAISNVFVDRCTFFEAGDGALDITGNVSNVTVQRSLFYENSHTMLVKYDTRQNISVHHNVFAHNGERNPQVKGDMQLFDLVNNVVYLDDVPAYPDGTPTAPYGSLFWSCAGACDSAGNVVANAINNVYLGAGATLELETDAGATDAGVYFGGNLCSPASNCAASPNSTPNAIPPAYAVTTLDPTDLKAQLLPYVGAPNRTTADQAVLDEVTAALP